MDTYNKLSIEKNRIESINIYHVGSEKCNPGHSFGPAIRQHYLFHYILKGKGYYHVKGTSYELTEGEGFLIYPGESTYYKADEKQPWEYCWISFDGYDSLSILQKCGFSEENLILKDRDTENFGNKLKELIDYYWSNRENDLFLKGQFYTCFSHIYYTNTLNNHESNQGYVDKAIKYINNNFTYDIRISEIAKHIGIDRTYLYKLFMESFTMSPQDYLINFRIKYAAYLLKTTDMNITEISYSCGFKETPVLCKHFKKKFKITPTEYRKNKNEFILL